MKLEERHVKIFMDYLKEDGWNVYFGHKEAYKKYIQTLLA